MSNSLRKIDESFRREIPIDEKPFSRLGWIIVFFGIIGFFLWATYAPLDKGVMSTGIVSVSGKRKTVQAPFDGIIKKILVGEGDNVNSGDILVELDKYKILSQIESLEEQYYTSLATESRLFAERDGLDEIDFSFLYEHVNDLHKVNEIVDLQKELFSSRKSSLKIEIEAFKNEMQGMQIQIKSLTNALDHKRILRSILSEQLISMRKLSNDGFFPRNRYLEIKRQYSQENSEIDKASGDIGLLQNQLNETQLKIEQKIADYQRDVKTQLAIIQNEISEFQTKLDMAHFELSKLDIKSPLDGTIVGLNVFTEGGIVKEGEQLMDILPSGMPLVVDAHLDVELIDKVHSGLPVELMFTAFNQNTTPRVPGIVTLVSADRLIDKFTGQPYFQVQVTVTDAGMETLQKVEVKPGMPVEVFIKMGTRSFLNYLFKPILDRAYTSLTEE
ncbi:HlyD family type I secretion periplasmic adaptor subunit [Citrobacter werkmanii]|uniref:HlyD family type I secretion periplasmic adaptor subunit n=1 Tax=Citrobacter werkmanii TaxID=67827 RepID=UPI00127B9369|nr:HlyD family type I secretion periplasmic adaptor subunit [Salmonella enterica]EAZ9261407.1 HlyD family type I secretion periplasmic adaptor subunit [Salmonella enterica]EBN2521035.1 hemolysin D [Salmonella enterica]